MKANNSKPSIPKTRTTIYIEANIKKAFKKCCDREDISMSQKVENYMGRFASAHGEGNPVIPLTHFIKDLMHTCFTCEKRFKVLYKTKFASGITQNVCQKCLKFHKEQHTVKKVLKKVGLLCSCLSRA